MSRLNTTEGNTFIENHLTFWSKLKYFHILKILDVGAILVTWLQVCENQNPLKNFLGPNSYTEQL